jgi:hypothetical protein
MQHGYLLICCASNVSFSLHKSAFLQVWGKSVFVFAVKFPQNEIESFPPNQMYHTV